MQFSPPYSGIRQKLKPLVLYIFVKMIKNYSKLFRSTGAFFSNSAVILKLIWSEQRNLFNFETFFFKKTNIISLKNVRITHKDTKWHENEEIHENAEKMARKYSLYWRSVEDQNRILLVACGSTCNRSKLSWDMKIVIYKDFCALFKYTRYKMPKWPNVFCFVERKEQLVKLAKYSLCSKKFANFDRTLLQSA